MKKLIFLILITLGIQLLINSILVADNTIKHHQQLSIDLITVSSSYDETKIEPLKKKLEELGFRVYTRYFDQTISDLGYVNLDENRVNSLLNAIKAPDSDVVWFLRGGAGALNLLPLLEEHKDELKKLKPKPTIGYSDVTAIHNFLNNSLGWPSVHGIVAAYNTEMSHLYKEKLVSTQKGDITNGRESITDLQHALFNGINYKKLLPLNKAATKGVSGELRGGNLTLFQATIGTKFAPDLKGKILILEDVNEGYRKIDRVLHHLEYADNLHASAVIFGQFHNKRASDAERLIFKTVLKAYADRVSIPVYYFPYIGHGYHNKPLFLGKQAKLTCHGNNYCQLVQDKLLK